MLSRVSAPDLLPDSRLRRHVRGILSFLGIAWEPLFCANCGKKGPVVPEENTTFAFYLCEPCHEAHGVPAGLMAVPDEVFFAEVRAEQIAKYGRELSPPELVEALKDGDNSLAKLAKDRPNRSTL